MHKIIEIANENACRPFNANETISYLKSYNPYGFMSWGVSKKVGLGNKDGECFALLIRVSGHHHKGWVVITLNFLDWFDVRLVSVKGEVRETITDIFIGDLFSVIDEKVERIPAYKI